MKLGLLLSTLMGVDYVVIGFDMEVQPLVTHNVAGPFCVSAICIDVVSNHLLFAMYMSAVGIDVVSSHTAASHTVLQDSRMHCKVQMNEWPLIFCRLNCISSKEWDETRPSRLCLKFTYEDFSVGF